MLSRYLWLFSIVAAIAIPYQAIAQFVTIYGGPTYNAATQTGYVSLLLPVAPGSTVDDGVAVCFAERYIGATDFGVGAFRLNTSGSPAVELANLGTGSSGYASRVYGVNYAGTAAGYADKFSSGTFLGQHAVRWDPSGNVTELANLGTTVDGFARSNAYTLNSTGTIVGYAEKYISGTNRGQRAVRWDASGSATELDNLGIDASGHEFSQAYALNSAGSSVGFAEKYDGFTNLGQRAVRWDASTSAVTELQNLGTATNGSTVSYAYAINESGVAVGYATKYSSGTDLGSRAVRWNTSGSATELGNLGTAGDGTTSSRAYSMNDAGAAVGYSMRYVGGTNLGVRAVRWDGSISTATELGNLGTDISGNTISYAFAINNTGTAVGYADEYIGGMNIGERALLWDANGNSVNLNVLVDPSSGWTLKEARGISNSNWVSGIGSFDPDGAGALPGYDRAFLINVSSVVPEPTSLSLLVAGTLLLTYLRPRASRRQHGSPRSH